MKKISRLSVLLLVVAVMSLAMIACGGGDNEIVIDEIDGYSGSINSSTKTVTLSVAYEVDSLALTAVKCSDGVSFKAYGDSGRTSELSVFEFKTGLNTFYLTLTKGEKTADWTLKITRAEDDTPVVVPIEVNSVEGYADAAINSTAKTIEFEAEYETTSFSLSAIKCSDGVTIEAFSDEERQTELTAISLEVGLNTFYLILTNDTNSEDWALKITRAEDDTPVIEPIEVNSVEGYEDAVINSTTKTIEFDVENEVTSFVLSAIKRSDGVAIDAFSDEEHQDTLDTIDLEVGLNTFYLVLTNDTNSEDWTLKITRAEDEGGDIDYSKIESVTFTLPANLHSAGIQSLSKKIDEAFVLDVIGEIIISVELESGVFEITFNELFDMDVYECSFEFEKTGTVIMLDKGNINLIISFGDEQVYTCHVCLYASSRT